MTWIGTGATINDSTSGGRGQILQLGTTKVEVETTGHGPGFVIIHSLLTGPEAFQQVVPKLAEKHTVHRIYLPGFGASTPLPARSPSIADLADVVAETMKALGCAKDTTVLGNGLGAFVALSLAIRHGGTFESLIVSNSGAGFSAERSQAFVKMSDLAQTGGMSAVADMAIQRIFPPRYLSTHPAAPSQRRTVLEAIDPGAFASACSALAVLDLGAELSDIANPTLVIAGAIDQTTPPEMGAEVAAAIRDARLVVIPECGHCPQLEQPTALLKVIADFLGR